MELDIAQTWTLIAVLTGVAVGNLWYLGGKIDSKIDSINARIDATNGRIDSTNAKMDAGFRDVNARIDALGARLDVRIDMLSGQLQDHIRRHAG